MVSGGGGTVVLQSQCSVNYMRAAPTRNVTVSGQGQSHLPFGHCALPERKAWHSPFLVITELWRGCWAEGGSPLPYKQTSAAAPWSKQGSPQCLCLGSAPRKLRNTARWPSHAHEARPFAACWASGTIHIGMARCGPAKVAFLFS